jgi:hypothetical protein
MGVVLGVEPSAGGFDRLFFLTSDQGLLRVMNRPAKSLASGARPDLFDSASIVAGVRQGGGTFLSEYSLLKRRSGIGAGYPLLAAASKWASFVAANAPDMESTADLFAITEKLLDCLDGGAMPGPALFKAFYLFARGEGLPAKEAWLANLAGERREKAIRILSLPIGELTPEDAAAGDAFAEAILRWMCAECEIAAPKSLS